MPSPDITVLGLGPAGLSLLTGESVAALEQAAQRGAATLLVRTERHPAAQELRARGHEFTSFDSFYQRTRSFEKLYPKLADAVLAAAKNGPVTYAVPGHPLLGEESVRLVVERARKAGLTVRVLPAMSFVDVIAPALAAHGELPDFTQWQVADGAVVERTWWDTARPTLIFQVDDGTVASRVKLALLEEYPDEFPVSIVRHAGVTELESICKVPLYQLDRPEAGEYDHLTTLYLPPLPAEERRPGFREFVDVVARLRGPDGCPWDRAQTYSSLRRFVIEEAYEVVEAIDSGEPEKLSEELGDLMLQVLLLSQIGSEEGYFDLRDVMATIVEKLIRRHPHVFGNLSVEDADEVLRNWDEIKRKEKPERTSVLDGVPGELPALMKALEVSKRVVKVGFEWPSLDAVFEKLDEEVGELKAELGDRDPERLRDEIGDLLFTMVNVARWLKVDPEEALRGMIERFGGRFREVERLATAGGADVSKLPLSELDRLWEQAKAGERA